MKKKNQLGSVLVLLVFAVFVGLLVERIRFTQLGRSLASCRDNETAARTLGVNVYLTKVIAFSISGTERDGIGSTQRI